jgi:hypothetical protein
VNIFPFFGHLKETVAFEGWQGCGEDLFVKPKNVAHVENYILGIE